MDYGYYNHQTAATSRKHFKTLDASGLYDLIERKMKEDATRDWCIADLAAALELERSTVSARLNEWKHQGRLIYTGKKPSKTTGVTAMHFRLQLETLF